MGGLADFYKYSIELYKSSVEHPKDSVEYYGSFVEDKMGQIGPKKYTKWNKTIGHRIKSKKTAHNRSVYAPLPTVAPGFRSPRSFRYAPLQRLTPPTFLQPWSCYASPYSGCKNVIYSRNVIRHFLTPHFLTRRALLGAGNLLFLF
jgi:hypothetical protein